MNDTGLASLGTTLPLGVAVMGRVNVRSNLLASTTPQNVLFGDSRCSYQAADYNTYREDYLRLRTRFFSKVGSDSPNLLLDSSKKVSKIGSKNSAYYVMKFWGCSGSSCLVLNPFADSVADSILFGKTPWTGPVNSQYPSDGVVVFMVSFSKKKANIGDILV